MLKQDCKQINNPKNEDNGSFNDFVDRKKIINSLKIDLLASNKYGGKEAIDLYNVLNSRKPGKLSYYSKKIINKIYNNTEELDKEAIEDLRLFQTAFIEMEGFFLNMSRKQKDKNGFDHLMGILDNMLSYDQNYNIEDYTVATLHDGIENIPGYNYQHLFNVYGKEIANRVKRFSKKKHIDDSQKKVATEYNNYYENMVNRPIKDLKIKFEDRINSLESMEGVSENFRNRKINETKLYFLNKELGNKVGQEIYKRLEASLSKLLPDVNKS